MANYSTEIATAIKNYFVDNDLKHTFDPERGIFKAGFSISDDALIGAVQILIRVNDDNFSSSALCPINAPANRRAAVAEYTTRVNWTLKSGNFEMDYSDGEIRYKVHVNCAGQMPTEPIIKSAIHLPVAMFKRYGKTLSDVIVGTSTAEDAFNEADGADVGGVDRSALAGLSGILDQLSPEDLAKLLSALGGDSEN